MSPDPLIVKELLNHIANFVEQKHAVFGGLPVCPFARTARVKNQINIQVLKFNLDRVDPEVLKLVESNTQRVLIVAHPDKSTPLDKLSALQSLYNDVLPEMRVFASHPLDPFEVNGLHTRREPYPNLFFISKAEIEKGHRLLSATRYFLNWPDPDLDR